jgi:outer membrane biosynthesis protein TonB
VRKPREEPIAPVKQQAVEAVPPKKSSKSTKKPAPKPVEDVPPPQPEEPQKQPEPETTNGDSKPKEDQPAVKAPLMKGEISAKTTYTRSAKGPIQVSECSADGRYVVLENTGKKVVARYIKQTYKFAQQRLQRYSMKSRV